MITKTVDIILSLKPGGNGAKQVVNSLKDIEAQANRTREKMEKLANVGTKLAMAGGAIVAPFALAMKKYVDTAKETEPISRRLVELNKKWEASQVRLGRVTAELVLPTLEKAIGYLDKIVAFAEQNPGVVKAALTIGTTLVVLGGIITTTAQLVSMVANIQGLIAPLLSALMGGGGVAAGGAAAGAGAGAGMAAAVTAGITAAAPFIIPTLIAALATAIVAPITLGFFNSLMGTNQTMDDLAETARKLPTVIGYLLSNLGRDIFAGLQSIGRSLGEGFARFIEGIRAWFKGGKASGGYMSQPGFYAGAERGREYVMNAATTRNAERAIGGQLTQASAASYMTNNINLANGQTVVQGRRQVRQQRDAIGGAVLGLLGA